jgi:hypothetical protein
MALAALAGPVYRALDTAELAFGAAHVQVTDDGVDLTRRY